jgi:hypothetical protein
MPLRPETESIGGFLPEADLKRPIPESDGLGTAGKIAGGVALGAGMFLAPEIALSAMALGGGASLFADSEGAAAAFRTENTIGSTLASKSYWFDGERDPSYDPWADIAGTPYEEYWDNFTTARSKSHADAIKADLDREAKDRRYLENQGAIGYAQGLAAGLFDPTILLPGGAIVRGAKGGVSAARTAGSVAAYGAGGAALTEGVLQATQQTRTWEESATAIAGATVLSGVLGAGLARRAGRDIDAWGSAVEADLARPAPTGGERGSAGAAPSGATKPIVEAVAGASPRATEVADAIRQTAEEILPADVRVQVVDTLGAPGDEGLFGIRAFHGGPHDFPPVNLIEMADGTRLFQNMLERPELPKGARVVQHYPAGRFDLNKIGTGEGAQVFGHGAYLAENEAVGGYYRDVLGGVNVSVDGKPIIRGRQVVGSTGSRVVDSALAMHDGDLGKAILATEKLKRSAEEFGFASPEAIKGYDDQLAELKAFKGKVETSPGGHLYEVDIDVEPRQLLDLDEKVGKQPVAGAIADLLLKLEPRFTREQVENMLRVQYGKHVYDEIAFHLNDEPARASAALREAGIPGLRYFDAGSRGGAGEGSRNIVMFDDSLIKVTKKNGEAVSAAERKDAVDQLFSLRKGDVTQTPEFKRWFGDSKVVDERGRPLVVYHGTNQDITSFAREAGGRNTRSPLGKLGFFFTSESEVAGDYAAYAARNVAADPGAHKARVKQWLADTAAARAAGDDARVEELRQEFLAYQDELNSDPINGQNVTPAYLAIENPMRVDGSSFVGNTQENMIAAVERAKAFGHDGMIFRDVADAPDGGRADVYVAFRPEQIKSAIGNRGTFDPNDPRVNFGIRKTDTGPIAEGRFDPQQLLITIAADALDPAKTLRHESIHALKQMGLFTPKQWKTLEAAAKKEGWLDTHNVRALYEDLYRDGGKGGRLSIREQVKEQLDEIFDEFAVRDIDGLRRLKDELPADAKELRRLFKEQDRLEMRDVERHFGPDYEGSILGAPMSPEAEAVSARIDVLFKKYKTEDYEFVVNLSHDLRSRLAKAEKLHARMTRGGEKYSVRADGAATGTKGALSGDPRLEAMLLEEAIAEQFSLWRQGAKQAKGALAEIFRQMQLFLERTGNALRGRGFQTADDVFEAVHSGEMAARAPGSAAQDAARAAGTGATSSAGAAAVQGSDYRLKGALGLEKGLKRLSPALWLQNSPSRVSRQIIDELGETGTYRTDHADWYESARQGAEMGQYGSVESRVKTFQGQSLAEAFTAIDDGFTSYRSGSEKRRFADITKTSLSDFFLGSGDKLEFKQFREAVGRAMAEGDTHEIPEVAATAKKLRPIFDRYLKEAIKLGMLPEGVSPETAPSYVTRLYDRNRIIAERPEFKRVIVDWLAEVERANARVREALSRHVAELDRLEARAEKNEAKLAKREGRLKEFEARAEEAGRIQQFAFKRALARREPLDALRLRLADLSAQIAEPLDHLAALKDAGEEVRSARDIARANATEEGQASDVVEQVADAAELEEHLARVIAAAEASTERLGEAGDLPLPKVEGRYEGPALSYDEIDDLASNWRFAREVRARRKPESLTAFVVRMGGIEDPGGDVLSMIGRKKDRPGLIRGGPDDQGPQLPLGSPVGERSNTLDAMALRAWENGFFADKTERPTINEFLDAIRDDLAEGRVVRTEDQGYFEDAARAEVAERDLEARGIDAGRFRREGQLRLFLGQSPSDAFAGEAVAGLAALKAARQQLAAMVAPYRDRLSATSREARRRERSESLRQSERGVFATQSGNRRNALADQISGRRAEIDSIRSAIESDQARAADLTKRIEEQVELYQGKTASEAQSAISARRATDAERAEPRTTPAKMLKPVRAAAEKIAAQEGKDAAELPGLADQIIDRILGTPEGRLPYDGPTVQAKSGFSGVDMDARGPLAARQFMIPDRMIEQWLERDIDVIMRAYVHTMAPDIELTKRFGSADMIDKFKEVAEEYARLQAQAKTPAERHKLKKQMDEDFRNIAAIRDRLRGTYAIPENPEAIMVRTARTALTLSYMSKLGGQVISAFTDPARFVMVHGLAATFSDGLIPLFSNFKQFRGAARELEKLHGAAELINDSRALRMADISDSWGANTKFERLVQSGGRNFGMISLMAPWNAAMKQFASVLTLNRIMRNAVKRSEGKTLSRREQEFMAWSGISDGAARRMGVEFKANGAKQNGLWLPNTNAWSDESRNVVDALSVALRKNVDTIIITPTAGELPKFHSRLWGKLLLQFKSFSISATQKMLIAGLQQRDMAALNGALLSVALGGLVYYLKGEMAGKPAIVPKSIDDPNWGIFFGEAFDRSGLAGILGDVNNISEKVTRGKIGLSAITGKPISRYASRNTLQSVAGPVFGMTEDALAIAGSVFDDRPHTQRDTHRVRQAIPWQNLFYLRSTVDKAEAAINALFGIPERAPAR